MANKMKILHILKSEPDEVVKILMEPSSGRNETRRFEMYNDNVDYERLIELVFESDKVICWW